jgi:hypothetical protein
VLEHRQPITPAYTKKSSIKPKEIKIEGEDDGPVVWGEHSDSTEEEDEDDVRRERRYGFFSRSMLLPAGVSTARIDAKAHDDTDVSRRYSMACTSVQSVLTWLGEALQSGRCWCAPGGVAVAASY